jgi:hypothetical protein
LPVVHLWFENKIAYGNTQNRDRGVGPGADFVVMTLNAAARHLSAQGPANDRRTAYPAPEQSSPVPPVSTAVSLFAKTRSIYSRLVNAYERFSKVFVCVLSNVKEHGAIFRLGFTALRSIPAAHGS